MSYEEYKKTFEEKNCTLLTTLEEFNQIKNKKNTHKFDIISSSCWVQLSKSIDLIRDTEGPKDLWLPEHFRQIIIPMFIEHHFGLLSPQSPQTSLPFIFHISRNLYIYYSSLTFSFMLLLCIFISIIYYIIILKIFIIHIKT